MLSRFKLRCIKDKKVHPLIVASLNVQSVKGNDIVCRHCEISMFIKDNDVDLFL